MKYRIKVTHILGADDTDVDVYTPQFYCFPFWLDITDVYSLKEAEDAIYRDRRRCELSKKKHYITVPHENTL